MARPTTPFVIQWVPQKSGPAFSSASLAYWLQLRVMVNKSAMNTLALQREHKKHTCLHLPDKHPISI